MSRSFHFRPLVPPPDGVSIGLTLAHMIGRESDYMDDDARINGLVLNQESLPWLRGVVAGARDNAVAAEATGLIEAIKQWGEIECEVTR